MQSLDPGRTIGEIRSKPNPSSLLRLDLIYIDIIRLFLIMSFGSKRSNCGPLSFYASGDVRPLRSIDDGDQPTLYLPQARKRMLRAKEWILLTTRFDEPLGRLWAKENPRLRFRGFYDWTYLPCFWSLALGGLTVRITRTIAPMMIRLPTMMDMTVNSSQLLFLAALPPTEVMKLIFFSLQR